VIDRQGALVAHPDISLVLQKTNLSSLPHVQTALRGAVTPGGMSTPGERPEDTASAQDLQGRRILTAHAPIVPLGWVVFAEQPLEEALEPLRASVQRTILLVLAGVGLSIVASVILARRMVKPIQALQRGAARIGAGELDHRIDVRTGDEVQSLADEFNQMAGQLQESYASLEQKVEDRTRELRESLEQQTATAEILRVISSSPTDIQPVLDAVAKNAAKICEASDAIVLRVDGEVVRPVASYGPLPGPSADVIAKGQPITRDWVTGRAILDRRAIHVHDLLTETGFPYGTELARGLGHRTTLATPMLREGIPIGAILIRRREVRPFTEKQIAMLQTFADQAVIAIENVRLFQELQTRSAELARSVEELRVLGEVSQAVGSTLDMQTVLTTIVSRAVQLSGTNGGTISEYEEAAEEFRLTASYRMESELIDSLREAPIRLGDGAIGRAALTRVPVQVPDILAEGGMVLPRVRDVLVRSGYRSVLAIPLLQEDVERPTASGGQPRIVGGLVVWRREAGEFSAETVRLLQTFATQSVLAIQNARLFREIEAKSRQLEVANRHKSEFLANMSHELRTPLNAIIGFSEVLLERMFGEINPKQEEYLGDILASGRHLLSLINDILDLSKIEAGRMDLEFSRFDLPTALENTLILVRDRATRHAIAVDVRIDPGLGAFVADERKLKQIVLNLLSNAVKFTPEGGRITLTAAMANGSVEIAVSDTGLGIADEDQGRIFEEFRQVGSDHVGKREGTGLGLALTKRFVELHGGRVWVKSAPGHGSTFTVTLPVRPWPES
jgi:signal transduction histidine kinase